tara:strand:+ start:207 stop:458 length:252 start_codon:yes stop_codon:yes gene_type:complete
MTHIISNKKVTINGRVYEVTAVNGLDRVDINNKLHDLNEEMDKIKQKMIELVSMREAIDYECQRMEAKESADDCDNLFEQMFG